MRSISLALPLFLVVVSGCAGAAGHEGNESSEEAEAALTRAQCQGTRGETDGRCRIEGIVEQMVVAEIDPFVVGEACVTFVKAGNKRYGLVRDTSFCGDPDHYQGGNVAVSFSKGAITLVSQSRRTVLKEYDADATYYDFSGELRESASADPLAAFDRLDGAHQVRFLYDVQADGSFAALRPGFVEKPIRIIDTLEGEAQRRALAAYTELREESFQNGGGKPDVFAVQKDGVTYAYTMAISGRSYGNWGSQAVFNREIEELERFSFSD